MCVRVIGGDCVLTYFVCVFVIRAAGNITWCTPRYGPVRGGFTVTILGTNLGNGNDILNVSLNGQYALQILSQSAGSVVFVAPECASAAGCFPNEGDVTVTSVSYGTTVRYRLFQYHDNDGAACVLCCAVLCCAVLCCAVLCCAVLGRCVLLFAPPLYLSVCDE